MRILFISNLFPPNFVGGYEIACHHVAQGLVRHGHEVHVLTSGAGGGEEEDLFTLHKMLHSYFDYRAGTYSAIPPKEIESHNYLVTRDVIAKTRPDVVYIWSLSQVSLAPAVAAEEGRVSVVYHIFDYSLLGTTRVTQMVHIPRLLERTIMSFRSIFQHKDNQHELICTESLQMRNVIFGSHFLYDKFVQKGIYVQKSHVVHYGVDTSSGGFTRKEEGNSARGKLLYVGRLSPDKGIHVLLQAVQILRRSQPQKGFSLTIVGEGGESYARDLRSLVSEYQLENIVSFVGKVDREQIPALYREHDLLIFPSSWEEPFGIVILEAMASGVPVVGTSVGGAGEILRDQENSLVCRRDDPDDLAGKIALLLSDHEMADRIAADAWDDVRSRFRLDKTLDSIEQILNDAGKDDANMR